MPTVVRHDNLKAAVVRACFFDPDSHDVYLAFAAHWGFTPLPTQPRRPEENGKQERSGGYVKDNALKGRRFRQPRRAECVSAAVHRAYRRAEGEVTQGVTDPWYRRADPALRPPSLPELERPHADARPGPLRDGILGLCVQMLTYGPPSYRK